MLSLPELLEDPVYKAYFCSIPRLPKKVNHPKPWRLFIQHKDGRWAAKDFATYPEAFKRYKVMIRKGIVKDAAINCRSFSFKPPMVTIPVPGKFMRNSRGQKVQVTQRAVWQPPLDPGDVHDYLWCSYCRRYTAFEYYERHHALNYLRSSGITIDPSERRCHICGASERLINPVSRERSIRARD